MRAVLAITGLTALIPAFGAECPFARPSTRLRPVILDAYEKACAHPNDAAAVGRLGMLLHAHEEFRFARDAYVHAASLASSGRWADLLGLADQELR